MQTLLNGWRRFGIVIATLWSIAVIALALIEYSSKSDGFFVLQSVPVGTVVAGNKVTLPDGKVITITEEEEFKLRFKLEQELNRLTTGQPLRPWEFDWSSLTSVPKVTQVRWLRLGLFAVLAPLIVWLIVEAAVLTLAWVRRGFAGTRNNTFQEIAPMGEILHANSTDELKRNLAQLDISVPERSEGRRNHHTERYCVAHLLATISPSRLSFPLILTHDDKPDFVLSMPTDRVGIEHTEAVPENVARAQFLREKGHGPEVHFIPHASPGEPRKTADQLREEIKSDDPGDGWVGDSAEREWADAMMHHVKEKMVKAAAVDFQRHSANWLLVYDNWPLPAVKIAKAAAFLAPLLKDADAFSIFDTIFVLNDSQMCEFRASPIVYRVAAPKIGS